MKIKTLHLKNYKKFTNIKLDFEAGLNIIYGNNESGKSSIISAIENLLYVDPNSKSNSLKEDIYSWNTNFKPLIEANFIFENKSVNLSKNFETGEISYKEDGNILNQKQNIDSIIISESGIQNLKIFQQICNISSSEIGKISNNEDIKNELGLLLTGGDVDLTKLIANLELEIKDLGKGLKKQSITNGVAKLLEIELGMKKNELLGLQEKYDKFINSKKIKDESTERLLSLKNEIKIIDEKLNNAEKLEIVEKDYNLLENEIKKVNEELQNLLKMEDVLHDFNEKYHKYKKIQNINNIGVSFTDITKKSENYNQELQIIDTSLENQKNRIIELNLDKNVFKNTSVKVYLVLFILSVASVTYFSIYNFLSIFNLLSFLNLIIWFFAMYTLHRKNQKYFQREDSKLNLILAQKSVVLEKIQKINNLQNKILTNFGLESIYDYYQKKTEVELLNSEYLRIIENIKVKLKDHEEIIYEKGSEITLVKKLQDKIKEKLNKMLVRKQDIKVNQLDYLSKFKITTDELNFFKVSKHKLQDEEYLLNEKKFGANARVEDNNIDIEYLSQLEESVDSLEKRYALVMDKLSVLEVLKYKIEDISTKKHNPLTNQIKSVFDSFLTKITNGKYVNSKIDNDFNIEVFIDKLQKYVSPDDRLSTGTVDQLYFLVRIALLQFITKGKKPILILDDVFVTFDELRFQSAMDILNELANNYQILYFTCHKDFLTSSVKNYNYLSLAT